MTVASEAGATAAEVGEIHGVAGPVVVARGLTATRLYNVVEVGHARPRRRGDPPRRPRTS